MITDEKLRLACEAFSRMQGRQSLPESQTYAQFQVAMRAALEAAFVIDWKALYRCQTAMRYMDANNKLTTQRAYEMADEDIARLERAAAEDT